MRIRLVVICLSVTQWIGSRARIQYNYRIVKHCKLCKTFLFLFDSMPSILAEWLDGSWWRNYDFRCIIGNVVVDCGLKLFLFSKDLSVSVDRARLNYDEFCHKYLALEDYSLVVFNLTWWCANAKNDELEAMLQLDCLFYH